jgi:hypothetical protein
MLPRAPASTKERISSSSNRGVVLGRQNTRGRTGTRFGSIMVRLVFVGQKVVGQTIFHCKAGEAKHNLTVNP